jgi:hypothetical protein
MKNDVSFNSAVDSTTTFEKRGATCSRCRGFEFDASECSAHVGKTSGCNELIARREARRHAYAGKSLV